ncbi:MAG: CARDB domain-containing protein [Methanosarcinaceae archaeon]
MDSDIKNGGIIRNITFESNETTVPVPDFQFNISGYIFNPDDSPCNGPDVHITNLNTSVNRTALVQPTSNYYHLVLNNSSVSTGNILRFNISCGSQSQTTEHTIMDSDIKNGGITRNVTFTSNETTIPVPDLLFMISGGIYYINEQEDFNPHISITNLNTTIRWNATTCQGYNFFNLHICTGDVNPGNVLEFNVTDNGKIFKLVYHTITQDDINRNGLFDIISPGSLRSDVTVESIKMPDWVCPGSSNRIYVTVKNTGTANAGLFNLSLTVDGIPIDNVTFGSLKVRGSAVTQFTWEPTEAGNYTLCARADPKNLLNESKRKNNNLTEKVKVDPVSVINVPHDYPSIQDAVNNSNAYTVIYVDEGDYEISVPTEDIKHINLSWGLNITDRDHLKILGTGEDTRIIVYAGSFDMRFEPKLIEIVNSSNVELNGFAVRVDSKVENQDPTGWRAINIRESGNISLTNLHLTHASRFGYLIKIEDSTDCLIADNFISGSAGEWATSGVFIASDNNTICNNTIINCQYTIKLQGDNNTVYANNLFFTESGKSPENAFAIDTGQDNYWNVRVPVSYRHNNTTFTNYIGNYWDGWTDKDLNDDGIWDAPYSIDTLTDFYPSVEWHELTFDLIASGIARPFRIYIGRNNTVLATIERKGTYPLPEPLTITLTSNDVVIDAKTITMGREQKKTLRFTWVPELAGSYDLKVDVQPGTDMPESDMVNNVLSTNVEVLSPQFNYTGEIGPALDFLNESQLITGGICGFSNSAWAALSVTAVGEDPAAGRWKPFNQSLIGYLQNDPKDSIIGMPSWTNPPGFDNIYVFAWMILVISAIGEDPTDYGGVNYLVMLESYYDGNQFQDPDLVEDDALAILALTACGADNIEMVSNAANHIRDRQNEDGGWSSSSEDSNVMVTSLVIQALVAAGDDDKEVIDKALNYIKNMQEEDGGFSDAITTSYVIMAITAAGENPEDLTRNNNNPIDYLLDLQQDDGSFNYTTNFTFFPPRMTIFPIQALAGVPYPVMIKTLREEPPLTDIVLGMYKIDIEDEVCVNTTYTVSTKIRSNGGIFDVELSYGGIPVNNKSVKSVWSGSTTPVAFKWKHNSTGTHDLTIEADTGNRINERWEYNNQVTRKVTVVLPDLYPDPVDAIVLPPEVYVNATNNVTVLIRGRTDESFNVTLKADGEILDEWMFEGINERMELSSGWRPAHKREYSLELIVDDGDKVTERTETNNTIKKQVNVIYPDLVPTAITPCPVYVNATNWINISIKGTAECFDISLTENGTEVGRTTNITCYGDLNVTVPWKPVRLGNYTLLASIDPGNNITETNEANNNITREFEVVLPDLVPVLITPDLIFLNETNMVIVTINGTAEGFNTTLLANGTCIGTGVDLDTYNGTIEFEWTPAHFGKYNLTVLLDSDNAIDETNETNNNLSTVITAANRIGLELLFPLGGEILGGMQDITWNATYEYPLSIDLLYSANNGYNWNVIVENTTNSGCYEWNTKDVIDGKYMIKVIARCGVVTEEDWSGRLYVYNKKSATEWSEFNSNGGYSLSDGPDTNEMAWASDDIGAEPSSSLIVADGKVFVYSVGWQDMDSSYTYLVALNESDGEVLWCTSIGLQKYESWATPTYNNGKIYVASGNGVYCIDATKEYYGPILWDFTFPDGGWSVNGGPVVASGKVYVGSYYGGNYYCIDAKNGTKIWNFTINGNAQSSPAAAYGRVFFGDYAGKNNVGPKAYAVDMDDGYEFWNTTVGDVAGSFTVVDGIVYFSTLDNKFHALDAANGTQIWTANVGYTDSTPAIYRVSNSLSYIYVAANGKISCFNTKNGETIWMRKGLGSWTNSPRVSKDGKVFVGKIGGGTGLVPGFNELHCLDALTGDEIWHTDSGGGTVAIANGKVYTTGGSRVYAFGSNTMPDLTVEKIYVPDKVNVNETVNIIAQINNVGKSNVNKSFSVELTHKGELIDKITVPSLDIGEVTNVSFNWTPQLTGNHRLVAEVDPEPPGDVTESGELTNNSDFVDVTVGDHKPDLAVTAIDAPYVNRVGMNINITVHMENIGSETNSSFNVSLMVDRRMKNTTTTSLLNNDSTDNDNNNDINNTTSVCFNWTPDKARTYSLKGIVDLDGDVDKTNNNMTKEIEVVTNETFFGHGPGYNGGTGGGSSGGIGSGHGTGESGEAGSGGMEYTDDTSKSASERISDISGFLFGDDSPGSSGGGGALSLALIICLIIILGLVYHGHRREKRSLTDAKHHLQPPGTYRRKNG